MEAPTNQPTHTLEDEETQAPAAATPPLETPDQIQADLGLSEADPLSAALGIEEASITSDWGLLGNFLILMTICAITAHLLERIYRHCGFSLSNRSDFSRNFVLLACTTMMIVTIVKSALAISIGLLGALSIVRFRAAIKEPEELCFLFLAIALGVGFGASVGFGFLSPEPYIPLVSFAFLTIVLFIRKGFSKGTTGGDYHLLVASKAPQSIGHGPIQDIIHKHSEDATLKRLDESQSILEANYQVHFTGPDQLEICRKALLDLGEGLSVSMIDNRGIGN